MKKLKLDLDTVSVLSFPTTSETDALRGTVDGAMSATFLACTQTDSRRGTSVCCETRIGEWIDG